MIQSVILFLLAGLAEIGGGYLVWIWLKDGKSFWYGVIGAIVLVMYGVIPTFQNFPNFGRVYAAYGGVFIVLSVLWGWVIDKKTPDIFDWTGAMIALIGVRLYVEALRAQAHEFMNKLHVILGMVHMQYYDDLNCYVNQIAQRYQAEVGFVARRIKDHVVAGFILGKISSAREIGAELVLSEDCLLPQSADGKISHELITILGNLLDNALEAVASSPQKTVELDLTYENGMLDIQVSDTGPGISPELKEQIFLQGYSTKAGSRGLGLHLVKTAVERLAGTIEVVDTGAGTTFKVRLPYESKGELN